MEGHRERELLPSAFCRRLRFLRLPTGVRGVEWLKEERHGEPCAALFLGIRGWPVLPPYPHALHRRFPPFHALPQFPGRQRVRIGPDALAFGLGGLLDLREIALLAVLNVPPSESLGDQLSVYVDAADMHVHDDSGM